MLISSSARDAYLDLTRPELHQALHHLDRRLRHGKLLPRTKKRGRGIVRVHATSSDPDDFGRLVHGGCNSWRATLCSRRKQQKVSSKGCTAAGTLPAVGWRNSEYDAGQERGMEDAERNGEYTATAIAVQRNSEWLRDHAAGADDFRAAAPLWRRF